MSADLVPSWGTWTVSCPPCLEMGQLYGPRWHDLSITHKFGGLPPYPNGIAPQSPGLGGTSYPGENAIESTTPSWVANPVGLQVIPSATRDGVVRKPRLTQGRRSCVAPTLGFEPESLWDSNIWSKNLWVMLRARHRCSFTPPQTLQQTHSPQKLHQPRR